MLDKKHCTNNSLPLLDYDTNFQVNKMMRKPRHIPTNFEHKNF